jgi:hypothetical protein
MELTKEQEQIKLNVIKNNMVYQEELDHIDHNLTEQQIEEQIKTINKYLKEDIKDTPTFILNDDYFILILAILTANNPVLDITDLDYNAILERYNWYNEGVTFFKDKNAFKILDEYGAIVQKDSNGFYEINDVVVKKVLSDSGFYITGDKSDIKNAIYDTWEDQTQMLTNDNLNKSSEERNGLNFKHFIFCEEYIKRGKIKPTCDYLGISRNTAYLWLKDDKVQNYLKERQEEIKQDTDNTFKMTYNECFNQLNEMINGTYIQNDDKIKAISTFLKHYENMQRLKQPVISED